MKRVLASIVLSFVLYALMLTSVNAADVQTCTQVTQYGGVVGIVCGAHTPVETGLADINPAVLASIFLSLAGYGQYTYKKLLRKDVAL